MFGRLTKQESALKSIGLEENLDLKHITAIWRSQFKLVRETMKEAERDEEGYYKRYTFKNIKLPHFGKFVVKNGRVTFLNLCRRRSIERKKYNEEKSKKT